MLIHNQFYILYMFWVFLIIKVCTVEIKIKNDSNNDNNNNIENIADTVNQLMQKSVDEIKLILNDKYYYVSNASNNKFNIYKTLIFYSEKGTTFDFQHHYSTGFIFNLQLLKNNIKIVFQNITFYDYYDINLNNSLMFFEIPFENNHYEIEFYNCTFKNIYGIANIFYYISPKSNQSSPHVQYINCKFM